MENKIQFINATSYLWYPACRAVCLCLSSGASITCVLIYFVLFLSKQLNKGLGEDSLARSFSFFCSRRHQRRDWDVSVMILENASATMSHNPSVLPCSDIQWVQLEIRPGEVMTGWNQTSVPVNVQPTKQTTALQLYSSTCETETSRCSAYIYWLLDQVI